MSTMSLQGRTCGVSDGANARRLHPRQLRLQRFTWPKAKRRGTEVPPTKACQVPMRRNQKVSGFSDGSSSPISRQAKRTVSPGCLS